VTARPRGRTAGAAPPAGSEGAHVLVHGMGASLVPAVWPPLEDAEVRALLAAYRERLGRAVTTAAVRWHSPRPMSAAGLIDVGAQTVFVKRHHRAVRSMASLHTEHALATHVRRRAVEVPEVVVADDGETVRQMGSWRYEVHRLARGVDLYTHVPSWHPYAMPAHARAAGSALARFHIAAADFVAPARSFGPLVTSVALAAARDSGAALDRLLAARPGLAAALARHGATDGLASECLPALERASRALRGIPRHWGHGDWHPSNLTWSKKGPDADVVSVLDLGLANRTAHVHDLALAIERSGIDWLPAVGTPTIDLDAIDALVEGYEAVRPLAAAERQALGDVLAVCHVEYALSEVVYFATVVRDETDTALAANDYLIGHCQFFSGGEGAALVAHLRHEG